MKITVFTPTYNRGKEIERVYNSLCNQTNKNFEWLVVDDGSTDKTEDVIKRLSEKDNGFPIKYVKKQNGGKYTAHNVAVQNATNELFLCVDSDDYLVDGAIDSILKFANLNITNEIIGVIALKIDTKGNFLSDKFPKNVQHCKKIYLEQLYQCKGEFTLIYKTSLLRKCIYPEITNERFIGENVIYDQLDGFGDMILFDEVITVCEYLDNGYTNNFKKLMINNPTGYKLYYMQRIDLAYTLKECIGYVIRYNAFSLLSSSKLFKYKGNKLVLVYLLKPIGLLVYLYYKFKD